MKNTNATYLKSNSKRVSTMYIFDLEVFVEGDDVGSI